MRLEPSTRLWVTSGVASFLMFAFAAPPAPAAGLLVAEGPFGGKLEIKEQIVQVTINNGIAVTQVDQVFVNTENRVVEALYSFPVPHGASVSNFSMLIGGKEMIGEVVEKKRAREIYESYKTTRRDPGLLEQVDYKSFELRVFPIAAGAEQHLSITYSQQLDFDHNSASYVYPLATTTKGPVDSKTTGRFSMTVDVKSAIPVVELDSPSHADDFVINSHSPEYVRASLELPEGDLSRDVVIHYETQRPHTGIDVVTSKRANEDGYFMLSLTAGKELESLATGMDYVFVVDISGSMADDGKLTLSRTAIGSFVDALGPEDRFEVMTFNTQPEPHFRALTEASDTAKQGAKEFLLDQRARGGTVLRPALMTAYKYKSADRPLNVVVLSDGMTEVREQAELISSIQDAPSGTRVFCIGIGNETNRPLLKQLAEGAGGLAAFISHQDDFARQADAFRRKLMRPVAQNVRLQIEGVDVYEIANEQLPDLYFGAPIWMIGRYRTPGQAKVSLSAEVLGQPIQQELVIEFPKVDSENPEIERMWAFERVQSLMNRMRASGSQPTIVNEIVRLCEGYSIVSEYASFIVLENDAEYERWSIERHNASRVRRDRAAAERLRRQLAQFREQSLSRLGPAETQLVSTPVNANQDSPAEETSAQSGSPQQPSAPPRASRPAPGDVNFVPVPQRQGGGGGGAGGGAIDPISGLIACGLAGAAAMAARRKRSTGGQPVDRANPKQ